MDGASANAHMLRKKNQQADDSSTAASKNYGENQAIKYLIDKNIRDKYTFIITKINMYY